jgi:hypothetical protein
MAHYTDFATRSRRARSKLGLEWHRIGGIVGHKTAEIAFKYTEKRRRARLASVTLDGTQREPRRAKSVNRC